MGCQWGLDWRMSLGKEAWLQGTSVGWPRRCHQQDIISFPHKDSSLDGEVKCADS